MQVVLRANDRPKQAYPWGDKPDPECANYADTKIGSTSAVGCFARGVSPYGVEELSGNVWEWTRSLYAEYPYPIEEAEVRQRENLAADSNMQRVLRGGAFVPNDNNARCAARVRLSPSLDWYDGFRVVLSPFTSGL